MLRKLLFMLFMTAFIAAVIGLIELGEREYPLGKESKK